VVKELLIMRDQSLCCYGVVPKITNWISVKMQGRGVKAVMDQPVTLYGTLHVGEMREKAISLESLPGWRKNGTRRPRWIVIAGAATGYPGRFDVWSPRCRPM